MTSNDSSKLIQKLMRAIEALESRSNGDFLMCDACLEVKGDIDRCKRCDSKRCWACGMTRGEKMGRGNPPQCEECENWVCGDSACRVCEKCEDREKLLTTVIKKMDLLSSGVLDRRPLKK
jgi:hypothetical protein